MSTQKQSGSTQKQSRSPPKQSGSTQKQPGAQTKQPSWPQPPVAPLAVKALMEFFEKDPEVLIGLPGHLIPPLEPILTELFNHKLITARFHGDLDIEKSPPVIPSNLETVAKYLPLLKRSAIEHGTDYFGERTQYVSGAVYTTRSHVGYPRGDVRLSGADTGGKFGEYATITKHIIELTLAAGCMEKDPYVYGVDVANRLGHINQLTWEKEQIVELPDSMQQFLTTLLKGIKEFAGKNETIKEQQIEDFNNMIYEVLYNLDEVIVKEADKLKEYIQTERKMKSSATKKKSKRIPIRRRSRSRSRRRFSRPKGRTG